MKSIFCFICFVLIISIPCAAISQTTAQIVAIKKGTPAPFDGTLLNDVASATIIAEKEFDKKKADLDKQYELLKMRTTCDRDIGNVKVELDISKKKYDTITTLKDEEIKRLTNVAVTAEKKSNNIMWWTAGGVFAGIVTSVAIFFAVSYGQK